MSSRLQSAVKAHLDATQKPLPSGLAELLQTINSALISESNGKLSVVPESEIVITDPEDQQKVTVPLPMGLGLLQAVRLLPEASFTELVIGVLTGECSVSFQSYLKSNNHYINILSTKKEDEDGDDSSARRGRRSENRG